MTPGARAVFRGGFEHAVRLGHRHLGSEHLLLALVAGDHPAAAVLRAHGLRPDLVEQQLVRLEGGIFGGLDDSSLSAIGIDLDAVRERALASFGPEALARAGRAVGADAASRRAGSVRWVPGVGRTQPGGWHGGAWDGRVFLPHSPDVGELLRGAREAGLLEPAAPLDVPQLAVGLLSATGGAVPPMLAALAVPAPTLRAAILRAAVAETGEPGGA
jgi:hypothetical protein